MDLSRRGLENGGLYWPAVILAILASIVQFYQSKMMLPDNKDSKKLSDILRSASEGKETDQSEVSAAISRSMLYFLPFMTFIFGLIVPAALTLYLLTSAAVGYVQQAYVLKQDEEELEELSEEKTSVITTTEKPAIKKAKPKKKKSSHARKKRRK